MTKPDAGFTLIETLIATAIMVAVTGVFFSLMDHAQGAFAAQPEAMDMQQRLRVGVDGLRKDLLMAGGGNYSGLMTGSLGDSLAPILPYRAGAVSPDPVGHFYADRITLIYVPSASAQSSIADPLASVLAELRVDARPGCPAGDASCGFKEGMAVLITDGTGAWDTFTITRTEQSLLHLRHRGDVLSKAYGAGSSITQIVAYTYWLKADTVSGTYQLMREDGNQTDVPIADNIVGLSFDYYGDPEPPRLRPGLAPATTYGFPPPALGLDDATDTWGSGENCLFSLVNGAQVPRLDSLGGGSRGVVKLAPAQLTDGPWCPDPSSPGRYDADLLRVRKVSVTLRVQASGASFRGATGRLFTHGGTAKAAERYLPDQEVRFDVTPRNLNLGR
jgi:prepilin-type N-terminal cleavage/methylation domain-containing protein